VVVSQHRAAVKHVDFALSHAGVSHVTICKGDQQTAQEIAVSTWITRPACRVVLLHAGAAAAGLTLVAAQHIFLLEPFDKPGQELQALNRCHRIGQTKPVSCTVYYAPRTVEERLLAFRTLERNTEGGLGCGASSSVGAEDTEAEAICLLAEGSSLPSAQKLRFLFGMLRRRRAEGEEGEEGGAAVDEDEDDDAMDDDDLLSGTLRRAEGEGSEAEDEEEDDDDEMSLDDDES